MTKISVIFYNFYLGTKSYCSKPEYTLLNLKFQGGLTYPNNFISELLSAVEKLFAKHYEHNKVFYWQLMNF